MPVNVSIDTDVLATITESVLPLVPEEVSWVQFRTEDGDSLSFFAATEGDPLVGRKWKLSEVA